MFRLGQRVQVREGEFQWHVGTVTGILSDGLVVVRLDSVGPYVWWGIGFTGRRAV